MSISLSLEKMSVEEKIQAMESIWDDLCGRVDKQASPTWHGEVLAGRESALQEGDDEFIDWETAKQNIKKHFDKGQDTGISKPGSGWRLSLL